MKKLFASVCVVAMMTCAWTVHAMPSQDEISEVQPLVAELMGPSVAAFKAKKMSGSEVGDAALKLAEEAEGEAAKFLCMKGAVTYYVKDKEYDKAADAIEAIMAQFPDMPPETLQEITTAATRQVQAKSAPRLSEIHRMAGWQVANSKKLKAVKKQLKEKPADKGLIRQYAELSAANGNWEEALKHFAKFGGDIGKMAKDEMDGKASSVTLAGFWWDYKAQEAGAKAAIRQHSAMYYQSAIDSGELKGLNKTLAEKRIDEAESVSTTDRVAGKKNQLSKLMKNPKFKKGLVGYWPFDGNANDVSGNKNNGVVKGVTPIEDRYGKENGAFRFNGSSCIEVPDAPSLRNIRGAVTMAAWIKPTEWYNGHMSIMQKGDKRNVQYQFQYKRDAEWVAIRYPSILGKGYQCLDMALSQWQFVALTYECGKEMQFYHNGKLIGQWKLNIELQENSLSLIIGCDPFGAAEYFIGDMDDVMLYNRSLTKKEIEDLYKAGMPR